MWGSCFLLCTPVRPSRPSSVVRLPHNSLTHNLLTPSPRATYSHTHTHNSHTNNHVHGANGTQAHHQSQPSAISATPATQNARRCFQMPRLPRTHTHTTCSHTTGAGRRGTWRHRPSGFSLVVRLGPRWRRGRRGCVCAWACARACGRAGVGVGVGVAGVAGVALGSRRGTWKQAWHSATSTFMLCGGHGTYRTSYVHPPPSSKNSHVLFQMHSINLLTHNLLTRNSLTRSVFRHLLSLSCLSNSENQCSNTLAPRKKPSQACAGKGQKTS